MRRMPLWLRAVAFGVAGGMVLWIMLFWIVGALMLFCAAPRGVWE